MRYYSRYQTTRNILGGDYPMVKLMILINALVFVVQQLAGRSDLGYFIAEHLALSNRIWDGEVWQLATYMYLHNDFWHILFNMLAVWMFGKELEMVWGSSKFLRYYFVCGIGAGLTFLLFSQGAVIGASGAVFGILLAFGMIFPDQIILMSFLFPIKAKYMVLIYGLITFLSIAKPSGDGIAHFAHLGGMVFGFLFLRKDWLMSKMSQWSNPPRKPKPETKMYVRPKPERQPQDNLRERVDAILDKINEVGYDHLTEEEKKILLDASNSLSETNKKDHH
ncbi:rhomboid family intramembrane serine protease [bacterium]|nr:rhomboid family intramembrane serine protease [bacterium]